MEIATIDALARFRGKRYATHDVVGCGPRMVAGIAEDYGNSMFYPYERAVKNMSILLRNDVIMISAMSSDYIALYKLVFKLRNRGFKGKIIVGGPISFEYVKLLQNMPIDLVVIGEAEIPLKKLLSHMIEGGDEAFNSVPAIAYKDHSGSIKITSRHVHTPKELLSTIKPWTRVDQAFEVPQVYRFYVEVVRGCSNFQRPMIKSPILKCVECLKCKSPTFELRLECPANIPPGCGFCSVPYMFGPPRSRSVESIVKEVSELVCHGARRIVLSGPDFLDYGRDELVTGPLTNPCHPPANANAIEKLLNELASIEEVKLGKVTIMVENIKACLVDEHIGKLLGSYLKGTTVHIGMETGCDWYNEIVLGKPIKVEHVIKASEVLRKYGIRPYVYIMYGSPMITKEVYLDTIRAAKKLEECGVEKITLYKYVNLPATAFEKIKPNEKYRNLVNELKSFVEKYNLVVKKELLGKEIEVFLLEDRGRVYGYPVKHGPVVFVKKKKNISENVSGCRGLVRVVDVESRFVHGILISVLEC